MWSLGLCDVGMKTVCVVMEELHRIARHWDSAAARSLATAYILGKLCVPISCGLMGGTEDWEYGGVPGTGWFGHREWEDWGAWVGGCVEALHVSRMLDGRAKTGAGHRGIVRRGACEDNWV